MADAPLRLHPMCLTCGHRKGGLFSFNGSACRCGHWEPPMAPTAVHRSDFNQPPTLRCSRCREVFEPPFTEFFYRSKNQPFGWYRICKACYSEHPCIVRRNAKRAATKAANQSARSTS